MDALNDAERVLLQRGHSFLAEQLRSEREKNLATIERLRAALSLIAGHAEDTANKYCKCASCIAKRALRGEDSDGK